MASASTEKVVLVTGGNNGIGLETCQQFAQQPNTHVIMASRSIDKGKTAIEQLVSSGISPDSISLVELDIIDDTSIAAAVKEVTSSHGRLDTLINNAGVCPTDLSRESFREAFEVNAVSPSFVTRAFSPLLQKSTSPRVIYVSSALGSIGRLYNLKDSGYSSRYLAYGTSKTALNMVVAGDTIEYGQKGIKVFAYCPGYVVSDLAGMRQEKLDSKVPGPEQSAEGLWKIHAGEQDDTVGVFLHSKSVTEGTDPHLW